MDEKYKNIGSVFTRTMEECSELIHILCKVQRFGIDNFHPYHKTTNRETLKLEISDVKRTIKELEDYLEKQKGLTPCPKKYVH